MLSYQYNSIRAIEYIHACPELVFLDFYANSLTSLQGLHALSHVRVLMLGRNNISSLAGAFSHQPLRIRRSRLESRLMRFCDSFVVHVMICGAVVSCTMPTATANSSYSALLGRSRVRTITSSDITACSLT